MGYITYYKTKGSTFLEFQKLNFIWYVLLNASGIQFDQFGAEYFHRSRLDNHSWSYLSINNSIKKHLAPNWKRRNPHPPLFRAFYQRLHKFPFFCAHIFMTSNPLSQQLMSGENRHKMKVNTQQRDNWLNLMWYPVIIIQFATRRKKPTHSTHCRPLLLLNILFDVEWADKANECMHLSVDWNRDRRSGAREPGKISLWFYLHLPLIKVSPPGCLIEMSMTVWFRIKLVS